MPADTIQILPLAVFVVLNNWRGNANLECVYSQDSLSRLCPMHISIKKTISLMRIQLFLLSAYKVQEYIDYEIRVHQGERKTNH